MKRTLALLMACAMVLCMSTACSSGDAGSSSAAPSSSSAPASSEGGESSDAAPADPVKLTWWAISGQDEFYASRAEAWNKENPDRPIELEAVALNSADRQSKMLVAVQSGSGAPDYCDVNVIHFGSYFTFDEIPFIPLNDVVEQDKDKYIQAKLNMYTYNGNLYGAPSQAGTNVVYYNTKIMEEAGVDIDSIKTWDDFYAAGQKVKAVGKPMTAVETSDVNPFQSMLLQRGSDFFDKDGNVILDNEINIEILDFLYKMVSEGVAIPMPGGGNSSETFFQFMNEDGMAALVMPLWYISRFEQYMPDLSGHMAVRPMPVWEGVDTCYGSAATGGNGAVIVNQCQNVEIAKDFLYTAKLSYDAGIEAWNKLGYAPFRSDCWEDDTLTQPREYFNNENVFGQVSDAIKNSNAINNCPLFPEAVNRVGAEVMYNVFEAKTMQPADALKSVADELRSLQ